MMKQLLVMHFYEKFRKKLRLSKITIGKVESDRKIVNSGVNKPGLALSGFFKYFKWDYIQILTKTEVDYINCNITKVGKFYFHKLSQFKIPCFIILCQKKLSAEFIELCDENNIPIFRTTMEYDQFMLRVADFLDDYFAPTTQIHGTLVDVYGTGLLLMGRSGIGKSEIALDLVERGHRLVTDDVVTVVRRANNFLIGKSQDEFNTFMEIRGVGIINVKEMFGTRAVRRQKRVEMIVQLEDWKINTEYDRLGIDEDLLKIHGVPIPRVKLPINPGKNITVIAETIALNLHLKIYGYNAGKELNKLLMKKMNKKSSKLDNYLEFDYE